MHAHFSVSVITYITTSPKGTMLKSYALWVFLPFLSQQLCWEEKGLRGKDFGKESSIKTGLSLAANFDSPNRLIAVFPLEAGRVLAILELTSTLAFSQLLYL